LKKMLDETILTAAQQRKSNVALTKGCVGKACANSQITAASHHCWKPSATDGPAMRSLYDYAIVATSANSTPS